MSRYHEDSALLSYRAHLAARRLIYPKVFRRGVTNLSYLSTYAESEHHEIESYLRTFRQDRESDFTDQVDLTARFLDAALSIDTVVHVSPNVWNKWGSSYSFQERFRTSHYFEKHGAQVTMSLDHNGQAAEVSKMVANYLLCAWVSPDQESFLDAVVVDRLKLSRALDRGKLRYDVLPIKQYQQKFAVIEIDHLQKLGALVYHQATNYHHETVQDALLDAA